MVSFCLHFFSAILVSFFSSRAPESHQVMEPPKPGGPLFHFQHICIDSGHLGVGFGGFFSKARKLCRPAQVGREMFLLGYFLKSRLQKHYTGIEFLRNKSVLFMLSSNTGCVTADTELSTQTALPACLGCVLTIFPGNSYKQLC